MFDTMTFTKLGGGLCGALLVFLLGKWGAEALYHADSHGEQSYVIDTGAEEVEEVVEEVDFDTILASADPAAGARVFKKCASCHKLVDGENATGPHLWNVVGRDKGAVDGFGYSATLAGMDGAWTPDNLNGFLTKPSDYAPDTSMTFSGLKKVQERADLIAYLATIK